MRHALLIALFALAACDATTSELPGTPPGGPPVPPTGSAMRHFGFDGSPDSITVDVPDTRVVGMATLTGGPLPDGTAARVEISGASASASGSDPVTIRAVAEGTAVLTVRLTAPGYRDTTLTTTLVSRVLCPPAPLPGTGDLFPDLPADGIAFTYHADFDLGRTNQYIDTDGTIRLAGGAATCYRGVRTVPLVYTFDGVQAQAGYPSTPITRRVTATLTEDSTNTVSFPAYSVAGGLATLTFRRYTEAGTGLTLQTPSQGCTRTFRLEAGAGLVSETLSYCYRGSGLNEFWSLLRMQARPART